MYIILKQKIKTTTNKNSKTISLANKTNHNLFVLSMKLTRTCNQQASEVGPRPNHHLPTAHPKVVQPFLEKCFVTQKLDWTVF